MCVVSLLLISLVIGLVAYSENINEMGIIKNTISKQSQIAENENITTVDVTNLEKGSNINHQHIFKTNYDNLQHWNECTICHEKTDITNHVFTTTWALGYESCNFNNSYTKTCSCGYKETGHKPCVWDGYTYNTVARFVNSNYLDNSKPKDEIYGAFPEWKWIHMKKCVNCSTAIFRQYYKSSYGSGKLYDTTLGINGNAFEYCCKSNGSKITCSNLGECTKCHHNYTLHEQVALNLENGEVKCGSCNLQIGKITHQIIKDYNTPQTYKIILNLDMKDSITQFDPYKNFIDYDTDSFEINTTEVSNVSSDVKKATLTCTIKFKPNVKSKIYAEGQFIFSNTQCNTTPIYLSPDSISPEIIEITSANGNLTEWSKTKPIVIKGTESYCDTVSIKIVEVGNEANVVFEGGTKVTNQKYELSCEPEIETGKMYKAIVVDTCENITEKEFEIEKVDAVGPKITSDDKVSDVWAKEKSFTFTSTDTGIGQVKIAFNDEKDYKEANCEGINFSRKYKFIGDVYSPKQAIVMYKDGLENISSKEVTIDKLDNTAPTITNASIHNNRLNITSNDIKEGLGEGSGVSKYRYITSTERLTNPEIPETAVEVNSSENIIIENISEVKYIYVIAEDLVGNVSEIYEVEVPQLVLTSKVNLNGNNGKGVVELDWSDYDLADKYFVIYRKKEDEIEWETIVPLEQKLTVGKYTDTLGNDKANPSTPTINIEGTSENNSIEITATAGADSGTKYSYYIESYDSNDISVLLNKSNISE